MNNNKKLLRYWLPAGAFLIEVKRSILMSQKSEKLSVIFLFKSLKDKLRGQKRLIKQYWKIHKLKINNSYYCGQEMVFLSSKKSLDRKTIFWPK